MSRKYNVTIQVEMDDESTPDQAETWAIAMLECAFKKKNPKPYPSQLGERSTWTAEIQVPPAEHPYRPKVIGAKEVIQPTPRST